ncbi:protein NRT1/ PTR FAMILY 1.2 [Andrographis paniculata]|uniref:protein NRT1/ PTR FAMILY 1.2 n=1 Tax=Andrographis paniculata TaxID=175694 RepID=UPI0021E720FC|nr:protein NRT1/ PTR FAMILY 1.2 [Andrographis paniculata]
MDAKPNLPSAADEIEINRQAPTNSKGGLITMPFIIANEALEKVATYGSQLNMVLYLTNEYKMNYVRASNLILFWSAATSLSPLLGAFVADSYLGRFLTIAISSILSILGIVLLWLTAMIPGARPPPCDQYKQRCEGAGSGQYTLLLLAFFLTAIGAGGIRACSMAFGADQILKKDSRDNARLLESFFSWYYASYAVSILVAFTGIVYIQSNIGWKVGFGVPAILMLFAAVLFVVTSPLYVRRNASKSLFVGLVQVAVVAYKNRELEYPRDGDAGYRYLPGSSNASPSKKLRFLNKACIVKNPRDVTSAGDSANSWNLCSTDQVENLKALITALPIWSTGVMVAISTTQNAFPVLQANSMDRHLTRGFQIPAASFVMFVVLMVTLWVVLYDRVIIPLASKIAGKKVRLGVRLRMGIGIFLCSLSMAVSGLVEHVRRKKAVEQGLANNPVGIVNMSAMWLILQYCLTGLAEAFFAIGQNEFFYTEFPKSMSSIASCLNGVGMGVGNLAASVVLNTVDRATSSGGKESWVSNNINKGRFDYYYWLMAAMAFGNLFYYIFCSWSYGRCADADAVEDTKRTTHVREEEEEA